MLEKETAPVNPAFVIAAEEGRQRVIQGLHITEKVLSSDTNGAYYVFEVLFAPGDGLPLHVHTREDEVFVVLEGMIDVFLGSQQIKARPGDILNFARGTPHGMLNTGTGNVRVLNTVIPGANFAQFFQELAQVPAGPPDIVLLKAIDARHGMSLVSMPQEV